jgi:hypothetical protein
MLQIRNYPNLLGQALFLEPEPFVEMVDDDNPWIEGLSLTMILGGILAVAQMIGSALLTASLPDPRAVLETLLITLQQAQPLGISLVNLPGLEPALRSWWPLLTGIYGYDAGWARLMLLIFVPLFLVGQWLVYGVIAFVVARLLGGTGSLSQTLGVTALALAPRILLVLTAIPFFSASALLFHVWGILLAYRGIEVAHDLPVNRAALAALAPAALLTVIFLSWLGFVLFSLNTFVPNWVGGGL